MNQTGSFMREEARDSQPRLLLSSLTLFHNTSKAARPGGCSSVHRMSRHEGTNTPDHSGTSASGFVR